MSTTEPRTITYLHPSGWRIEWPEGARLATITDPAGAALDAVQVVEWDWAPEDGGMSRATSTATRHDLAEHLAAYCRDALGVDLDVTGDD